MEYRFDEFVVDTESFELRRGAEVLEIEPQVYELLRFFCENPGRVLTRDEIVREVWGGRSITDSTIATCVKFARKALGESGDDQRAIVTVRGRGFRFAVDVRNGEESVSVNGSSDTPDAVTLAVLPFSVLSEDLNLEYFADGLIEDLTSMLARVTGLTLISSASTFAYKGKSPSHAQIRAEVKASHVVTGSIRPLGGITRVNVELSETNQSTTLWSHRFDQPVDRFFELQDEIATEVGRVLEPRLVREVFVRSTDRHGGVGAWQDYTRADGLLALKGWSPETFVEAETLLRRSIEEEPDFARAHAFLSLILGLGQRVGLVADRTRAVTESQASAEHALAIDNVDSTVLGYTGCAMADIGEVDRGLLLLEQAVDLDPSNAQAWAAMGAAKLASDRPEEAVLDLRHGIRISPLDNRLSVWGSFLAHALLLAGENNEALHEAELACRRDSRNHIPQVMKAAILYKIGRLPESKEAVAEALRQRPGLMSSELMCLVGPIIAARMKKAGLLDRVASE